MNAVLGDGERLAVHSDRPVVENIGDTPDAAGGVFGFDGDLDRPAEQPARGGCGRRRRALLIVRGVGVPVPVLVVRGLGCQLDGLGLNRGRGLVDAQLAGVTFPLQSGSIFGLKAHSVGAVGEVGQSR